MLTTPVVITWPVSTWVTRVIGTKIERRPNTSTTSPSTRGCRPPGRSTATRSRTLPTWSPAGSNTGRPERRAAKTREGEVLTTTERNGWNTGAMRSGTRLAYDIVDVFTDRPFAGNQLAVVHGADELSSEQCLAITREFGFSETTFPATEVEDGREYATRIFTPAQEIPFAGHPTLGTASVLRASGRLTSDDCVQVCGAGRIGVRFSGDGGAGRVELHRDAARPRGPAGAGPHPRPAPRRGAHAVRPGR